MRIDEQMIRTDCYLAVLKKYKKEFPEAHFEIITRTSRSILAPSGELLVEAGIFKKKDGMKNPKIPFKTYKIKFIIEILKNLRACSRLIELKKLSKEKVIFLVCYEKNPEFCHRSIIKEMIENYIQ